jgi:hypothetical protein
MTDYMTTEAQTQEIPRVPPAVAAVPDADAAAGAAAPEAAAEVAQELSDPEVAQELSVQEMYEAGLGKLAALHGHWAAAMAEIREAQATREPGEAAA